MRYRRFGRTELEVSELVFGGGAVGGLLVQGDDAAKRVAIRRALAAGINWVDTAPAYGQGKSESALGWLLAETSEQPYISTKVRLDPTRLDDIPGQVEESITGSLKRLRRDCVDLVQLHNPIEAEVGERSITPAHILASGGAADAFATVRAQGLTRFIGMTALGDAACCRQVLDSGRFDSAQVYYNMLNPSAGQPALGAMPRTRHGRHGDPCLGCRFSRHRNPPWPREYADAPETEVASEEHRARVVRDALGTVHGSPAQAAIRFALANDDISAAITGLANVDQLEEALAAADSGPLPSAVLDRLELVYDNNFGL